MKKISYFVASIAMVAVFAIAIPARAQVATNYWKLLSNYISPNIDSWGLQIPSLANLACIGTDSTGKFQLGTCGSGSRGVGTTTPIGNNYVTVYTTAGAGALYGYATTSASAAYGDVWRDANQNAFAQNFVSAGTSFPTNGGTVTLTAASPRTWVFTGTLSQTMKLPVGTTLGNGTSYYANNNSTGVVTVVDNGSNTLGVVPSGGSTVFALYDNSTSNGSWDAHPYLGHGNVSGTNILGIGSTTPTYAVSVEGTTSAMSVRAGYYIGTTTATSSLSGGLDVLAINQTGTATSTFAHGINIASGGGCFAVNGTCISGGGAGTVTSIATNNGLTGGTITTSGTIGLSTFTADQIFYVDHAGTTLLQVATSSLNLGVTGGGTGVTTLTGVAIGNGTSAFTAGSTQTCTNQFVRAMSSSYVATCATVSAADVSLANLTATNSTLTFSGTYNGSTARTIGLNVGNANTWTALQTFSANASTTQLTVSKNSVATSTWLSGGVNIYQMLGIGGTSTTTISGDGATSTFSGGINANGANLYSNTGTTTIQQTNGVKLWNGSHGVNVVPGTSTTTLEFF